jgi:RNA polymerase-binding protein DksA
VKTAPATRPARAAAKSPGKNTALASSTKVSSQRQSAATQASQDFETNEPLRPRPLPVPTDGKPRKNQAGLGQRDLEHFRDLLLAKRRELVGDMSSMEREALRSAGGSNLSNLPLHMADMGTDNYEQEFTLGLMEKDRNLLREINQALAKIQDGSYGICEGTGKPIGKPRLEAQPWARFGIEYARKLEKGPIRQ